MPIPATERAINRDIRECRGVVRSHAYERSLLRYRRRWIQPMPAVMHQRIGASSGPAVSARRSPDDLSALERPCTHLIKYISNTRCPSCVYTTAASRWSVRVRPPARIRSNRRRGGQLGGRSPALCPVIDSNRLGHFSSARTRRLIRMA